ncbi:hypothetical protein, partial [Burkholderia gladioli]|uniref:hypothetical protein n=1 Tax=Burkholderia gladioli TaxID=28095 RepID=UPI002FE10440
MLIAPWPTARVGGRESGAFATAGPCGSGTDRSSSVCWSLALAGRRPRRWRPLRLVRAMLIAPWATARVGERESAAFAVAGPRGSGTDRSSSVCWPLAPAGG